MDYNFELIADELSEKMEKRVTGTHKLVLKQLKTVLDFVSFKLKNEDRQQLEQIVSDALSDDFQRHSVIFIETLNKINRAMKENLK